MGRRLSPATIFVLKALVPYSKSNLMLASTPNAFFNELERLSRINKKTIRSAYYRAIDHGLIDKDDQGRPYITTKGYRRVQTHEPERLPKGMYLLIAFDIPEDLRTKRRYLRALLKELKFEQVQRSVWVSNYNHTDYIRHECEELEIHEYVKIFEGRFIEM